MNTPTQTRAGKNEKKKSALHSEGMTTERENTNVYKNKQKTDQKLVIRHPGETKEIRRREPRDSKDSTPNLREQSPQVQINARSEELKHDNSAVPMDLGDQNVLPTVTNWESIGDGEFP